MALPRIVAGPRKPLMLRLLANGIAQVVVAFAIAWLLRDGRGVLAGGGGSALPVEALLAALLLAGAVLVGLRALERVDAERMGQDYATRVRLRIFDGITARPSRDGPPERYGLTMTRLVSDLNSLRNWVAIGVARMSVACVSVVGLLAALAWFAPAAAVVATAVVAVSVAAGALLTPALRRRVRESRRRRGRMAGNLGEKVIASETVRHFGRARAERRRLRRQSRGLGAALVQRMRVAGVLRSLPDAAVPVAAALLVAAAAFGGGGVQVAGGDLVVAVLLLGMIGSSMRDIAQAWDYRLSFEEGRRRIEQLLAGPRLVDRRRARPLAGEGPVSLEYRRVRVDGVFDRVSVRAGAGERVLLTGGNGGGASNLLALAARLFDPDGGRVLVDGRPLHRLPLDSVHEAVQLVSPALPLLRGTVGENVSYGAEAPSERVADLAARCGLDVPSELPEGLDTPVAERGANLPEGLRARIALARALMGAPRLLLVDDPAFARDARAGQALERALAGTAATVLLVGDPSLEASLSPDRVWRLGAGRVLESRPEASGTARVKRQGAPVKIVSK